MAVTHEEVRSARRPRYLWWIGLLAVVVLGAVVVPLVRVPPSDPPDTCQLVSSTWSAAAAGRSPTLTVVTKVSRRDGRPITAPFSVSGDARQLRGQRARMTLSPDRKGVTVSTVMTFRKAPTQKVKVECLAFPLHNPVAFAAVAEWQWKLFKKPANWLLQRNPVSIGVFTIAPPAQAAVKRKGTTVGGQAKR